LSYVSYKDYIFTHKFRAENNADIFLTTDSRLLSKSLSYKDYINIIVANPMIWLAEATNNIVQGGENDPN